MMVYARCGGETDKDITHIPALAPEENCRTVSVEGGSPVGPRLCLNVPFWAEKF